jgi:hypothetical protein
MKGQADGQEFCGGHTLGKTEEEDVNIQAEVIDDTEKIVATARTNNGASFILCLLNSLALQLSVCCR